jgi:hypothetical protein
MKFQINRQRLEYDHGYWTADAVERMAREAIVNVDPTASIEVEDDKDGARDVIDCRECDNDSSSLTTCEDAERAARDIFSRLTTDDGDGWVSA